jgi:D-alanyl-D-alanine carboxypeptidase/D-alanyl-D-alanine-endopeptidase (penicillin-binding protein 4)
MRSAPLLLIALVSAGCAANPRPAPMPPGATTPTAAAAAASSPTTPVRVAPREPPTCPPPCSPRDHLTRDLDAAFAAPALRSAIWGVKVQSLDTGAVIYELNPDTLLVPASNTKIVTTAVAAERLGWDFRFVTRLESSGPIDGGTLRGDLVVVGGGDPTMNDAFGGTAPIFDAWAAALREAGISRIEGRIVGDDNALEERPYGNGWSWDDFAYGYQAPFGALQIDENLVEVTIAPGAAPGDPAQLAMALDTSDLVLVNRLTTGAPGTPSEIDLFRLPGQRDLEVTGTIAVDAKPVTRETAVNNPTRHFATRLRAALLARSIEVTGDPVDMDELERGDTHLFHLGDAETHRDQGGATSRRVLATRESPPLREVAVRLMKVSQNLYAETVLRALSLTPGPASVEASQKIQEEVLASWGIAPGQYALADGSGLSRHNLVTASTVVRILQVMARSPAHAGPYSATLPIAGKDGTIAGRLRATRGEGNVRAKTGTLMRVRALSGYLTTAVGERLVFSVIANHFLVPPRVVDAAVDQALERLVTDTGR